MNSNFIYELFQKEKDKCAASGKKFGYYSNEREILENMTESLQEKYPQIKIDTENLTKMIKWQLTYAYCSEERSRLYKRQSYDAEENMANSASNAISEATNEQNIFVQNIIQATNITADTFNEELFENLRLNNFRGGFANPLLDLAYKNYCENKEKDHSLQELQSENSTLKDTVKRYESVINYDTNLLGHLTTEIEELQTTLSDHKSLLNDISDNLDDTQSKLQSLNEFIEQENKKNMFIKMSERVKGLFNKTPKLSGFDTSYNTIFDKITKIKEKLANKKSELQQKIQTQKENSLPINEINSTRNHLKNAPTTENTQTIQSIDDNIRY